MSAICAAVSKEKSRKAKTRRLLQRFDQAVVDRAVAVLKGPGFPVLMEQTEAEYQRARKALLTHIDEG